METTVYLPKHSIFQWTVFKEAFDSDEGLQFELIGEDKNFWTLTTSSDLNTVLAVKSITLLLKDSDDPITIETNFQENPNQPSPQKNTITQGGRKSGGYFLLQDHFQKSRK